MEWPKTVTGWVALGISALALLGAGGFAGLYRWAIAPINRRIDEKSDARDRAIKEEREARERAIDQIVNREHGFLTLHKNELKHDINAVGERVNVMHTEAANRETRVRELEGRMRDSEHDRATIHKEVGALEADVKSFREEQNQMRIDIIAHIQDAKKAQLAATEKVDARVQDVERKVAVLDDRQRRGEQQ